VPVPELQARSLERPPAPQLREWLEFYGRLNGLCSDTTSSSGGWAHSCAAMGGRKARGFDEISRRLLLLFVVASSMLGATVEHLRR